MLSGLRRELAGRSLLLYYGAHLISVCIMPPSYIWQSYFVLMSFYFCYVIISHGPTIRLSTNQVTTTVLWDELQERTSNKV
jgi:hypothetical protein